MSKIRFLILVLFFSFSFAANAGYLDGTLLRAKGDIKVYLINNNTKKWVSSIEVFNFRNFKWQSVKVVSKKEVASIKEGEPIVLESASPHSSPKATEGTTTPIPSVSSVPLIPAKVNLQFPAPDYIRADWLISHITSNFGRIGQRIVFKYSDEEADKIENFRLYEKKPGHAYFVRVATFEEMPSTGCEDIDIDGEWMMTEAGQCGYWSIQRIVPPGGRGAIAYLSAANYSEGEYIYYVVGADKDGQETRPSSETKLMFLSPVDILSPTDNQRTAGIYQTFKWSIASSWPVDSTPDYLIMISDDKNAQIPLWTKQMKVTEGNQDKSFIYDGLGLDFTKQYKVYIYGHYRKSEHDPDFVSIPLTIPEFQVKSSSPWTFVVSGLRALFSGYFDFSR